MQRAPMIRNRNNQLPAVVLLGITCAAGCGSAAESDATRPREDSSLSNAEVLEENGNSESTASAQAADESAGPDATEGGEPSTAADEAPVFPENVAAEAPVDEEMEPAEPSVPMQPVRVRFESLADGETIECGDILEDVGELELTRRLTELRFFVAGLSLIAADGTTVPVTLTEDDQWQQASLGLIDLDENEGECRGSPGMNDVLLGEVPEGEYTGLTFSVGVPSAMYGEDLASGGAPLDRSDMQWPWAPIYNYFFLAVTTEDPDGILPSSGPPQTDVYSSFVVGGLPAPDEDGNDVWLPLVTLDGFSPKENLVGVEVAELVRALDLTTNGSCIGSNLPPPPIVEGCSDAIAVLGVDPVSGSMVTEQRVFSAR